MTCNYNDLNVIHIDDSLLELKEIERVFKGDDSLSQVNLKSYTNGAKLQAELDSGFRPHLALIDIHIGAESGLAMAVSLRQRFPELVVIMRSNDAHQGVEAAKSGIDDYVTKDVSAKLLRERLNFHINSITSRQTLDNSGDHTGQAVGETIAAICDVIDNINHSAVTSVHIKGDTGTGKEKVARLFNPSVSIDCGALPDSIVESELFGYKRGAFTGARQDSAGLLDVTDGRWIFLDEIGNVSPKIQAALLRAIGEREIRPIGSQVTKKVNFKLISATNEDLQEKVKKGEFRADLYQRLTEYTIELKPLVDRREEIPELIEHFCKTLPGGPYIVDAPVREVLTQYGFQNGNIRELRRALVTMTVQKLGDGSLPFLSIPAYIREAVRNEKPAKFGENAEQQNSSKLEVSWEPGKKWDDVTSECLLAAVRQACSLRTYSLRELAPIVGIQRSTLSRRLQELQKSGKLSETESTRFFKRELGEKEQENTSHVH